MLVLRVLQPPVAARAALAGPPATEGGATGRWTQPAAEGRRVLGSASRPSERLSQVARWAGQRQALALPLAPVPDLRTHPGLVLYLASLRASEASPLWDLQGPHVSFLVSSCFSPLLSLPSLLSSASFMFALLLIFSLPSSFSFLSMAHVRDDPRPAWWEILTTNSTQEKWWEILTTNLTQK